MSWLNTNSGLIMAFLTLVYVIATIFIMTANRRSVNEIKKTREEENRPYVVVYLSRHSKNRRVILFVAQNVGKTLAKNVVISSDPSIDYPKQSPLSKTHLISRTIPNIPPGYKIETVIGEIRDFQQSDDTYPIFKFDVSYANQVNTEFKEIYISDLNTESEIWWLGEMTFEDFAKDFDSFKDLHIHSMNQLIQVLKGDNTTTVEPENRQLTVQDLIGWQRTNNEE